MHKVDLNSKVVTIPYVYIYAIEFCYLSTYYYTIQLTSAFQGSYETSRAVNLVPRHKECYRKCRHHIQYHHHHEGDDRCPVQDMFL